MSEWSEHKCLSLIDAYKEHSILWNPKHKDYYKKNLKEDAWANIGSSLNESGEACKQKMIILLASYRRERMKIKKTKESGKGKDEMYESKWYAFKALAFLDERFTYRRRLESEDNEQESLVEWERGLTDLREGAAPARKWSARSPAHAQDTATDGAAPLTHANNTDACKMLIYIVDAKNPIWRLSLCGGNAAQVAAKAGTKLLPPKIKIVWNPPTTPYQHTEKLRLVVTAVNSGAMCNDESQFVCGSTSLCISSYLVCDGVRHCPGGEDEDSSACAHRRDPPFLELLRRFAARNQELLGLDQPDGMTKPSVIMKIGESEQKSNAFLEFAAALKPYGPWSYLVVGMLICATILMFCLAWECCCKRSKPSDTPINIPPSCIDMPPTVTVTSSSQQLFLSHSPPAAPPTPPEYEPPPSYSSLFPRAFKSSPTPVPHCSHQEPPD